MVDALNRGDPYRAPNTIILIMGPPKGTPNFGKPGMQARVFGRVFFRRVQGPTLKRKP